MATRKPILLPSPALAWRPNAAGGKRGREMTLCTWAGHLRAASVIALLAAATNASALVTPTGAFATSVPIELPLFHGITPSISLQYDSQAGNGPVGIGWSLAGFSQIRRASPSGGLPSGTAGDLFRLDGNDLIPCAGAAAGSPIALSPSCKYALPAPLVAFTSRIETFQRIAFDPAPAGGGQWLVWERDGTRRRYEPSPATGIYLLAEVRDTVGNAVSYSYMRTALSPGHDYPNQILYNQTAVTFHWEARPDTIGIAQQGGKGFVSRRLLSIDVQVEGQRARAYGLEYAAAPVSGRSSLVKVTQYGRTAQLDAAGKPSGPSLPAASLKYDAPAGTAQWQTARTAFNTVVTPTTPTLRNQFPFAADAVTFAVDSGFVVGDFDGDGRSDTLAYSVVKDPTVFGTNGEATSRPAHVETHVRLATQDSVPGQLAFEAASSWTFDEPPLDGRERLVRLWVADVNGDGLDDLVVMSWRPFSSTANYGALVLTLNTALSTGKGTFVWARNGFVDTPWITNVVWGPRNIFAEDSPLCTPGDFNGDGRADFACTFQNSGGKHFLGVASAGAAGQLTPALSAEEIADDPGVAVPGTNGFVPFETRRIAAADVDGDGLTDLVLLDLNPADTAACAALGDPTVHRVGCPIHYDLLTMVSTGAGFERERTPTPWLRADFLKTVPGHLAAGDFNGDGRADVVFFTGTVKGDRFQRLSTVRTAIRQNGGYALTEMQVPAALAATEVHIGLGDANGDGRTDLMVVNPIAAGAPGVGCSNQTFPRAVLSVAPADASGAFVFPSRWDDCTAGMEVKDQWAEWTKVSGNMAMLQVADTNGDGYADFVMPTVRLVGQTGPLLFTIHDRVSQPGASPARRWIATDTNADGRSDFIALVPETNSTSVISLIAQADGSYKSVYFPLGTFANPSLRSWRVFDVDGDGRRDLVHTACAQPSIGPGCRLEVQAFLSRGDGSFTREAVHTVAPVANAVGGSAIDLQPIDIDRDGRVDLVQPLLLRDPATQADSLAVRSIRSLGGNWQSAAPAAVAVAGLPTVPNALAPFAARAGWKTGDFDGDGRGDLLHITSNRNDARITVLNPDGAAWAGKQSVVTHPAPLGGWAAWRGTASPMAWRAVDANGDGVTDLVRLIRSNDGAMVHALESLGPAGWNNLTSPITLSNLEGLGGVAWHALDIDNDGAADWLKADDSTAGTLDVTLLPGSGTGYGRVLQASAVNPGRRFTLLPSHQWGDLAGDGRLALAGVQGQANGSTISVRVQSLAAPLAREAITALDTGARTEVRYQRATSAPTATGSQACALPAGLPLSVVREVRIGDGRSNDSESTTFAYSCPAWSHRHRMLLGWANTAVFRSAAAHHPASVLRTTYQNDDTCLRRTQSQGVQSAGGQWVGPRSTRAFVPPGAAPPFHCQLQGIQHIRHGAASNPVAVNRQVGLRYDEFGNLSAIVDDGLSPNLVRATLRSFNVAPVPYVVNTPRNEQVHAAADSSGAILRARIFCYDGDTSFTCDTPPTRGLPSARIDLWEQGTRITRYQHDAFGNLASVMDANNHGTAYFYDPVQHIYLTQVVNALSQTVATLEWDRVAGKPTRSTGQNSDVSVYSFDEFGRWTGSTEPDGGSVTRRYEGWGDAKTRYTLDTVADGSADGLWERQYVDGLGRTYRIERKSEVAGQVLGRSIVYADAGLLPSRVSLFSRWRQSGPFRARAYVSDFYDEAMRPVRTQFSGGDAITLRYFASGNRFFRELKDEAGLITQTIEDAFGRRVETRGFDGGATVATRFEYDLADQLTAMRDPVDNITRYTWDRLGRHTGVNDPNLGQRTLAYDKADNLISSTDARNRTIRYVPDELNRIVRKIYPGNAEVVWRYDEPGVANGRGRLTSFTDLTQPGCGADPSARFAYTRGGQMAREDRCVRGHKASLTYGYTPLGRLDSLLYPDGELMNFQYDPAGRMSGMPGWVSVSERDADGRVTRMELGNGITRSLTYDVRRQWLRTQRDARGATTVFDMAYDFKPNGLLSATRSASNGWNLVIGSDGMGRLRSISGSRNQTWNYDAAGNMVYNSARGFYTYPSPGPAGCTVNGVSGPCKQPHAALSAGGSQLHYDDNGLLSYETRASGQMRSIDWNDDHLPLVMVDFDGTHTDFEYDASGQLVAETRGAETVLHLGSFVRKSTLTGATQLVSLGGKAFAEKNAAGEKRWYHLDRAGALRAVSDASGQVTARSNYGPYGQPVNSGGQSVPVPLRHAQAELLGSSQLQVLGARLYDADLGRFLGPDTLVPDLRHPQSTNRYAYGYNAPLDHVDPSGHQPIGIETQAGGADAGWGWSFNGGGAQHALGTSPLLPTAPPFLPPPSQMATRPADMGAFLDLPWDQQMHLIHQDSNPSMRVTVNGSMDYEKLLNVEAGNTVSMTWAVFDHVLLPTVVSRPTMAPTGNLRTYPALQASKAADTAAPKVAQEITEQVGEKGTWFKQGMEHDAKYASLTWRDKIFYEIGHKALPDQIYAQYAHILDPVARGRAIAQDYGLLHGLLRVYPVQTFKLLGTGPTSSVRELLRGIKEMKDAAAQMTPEAVMSPAGKGTLYQLLQHLQDEQRLNERLMCPVDAPP